MCRQYLKEWGVCFVPEGFYVSLSPLFFQHCELRSDHNNLNMCTWQFTRLCFLNKKEWTGETSRNRARDNDSKNRRDRYFTNTFKKKKCTRVIYLRIHRGSKNDLANIKNTWYIWVSYTILKVGHCIDHGRFWLRILVSKFVCVTIICLAYTSVFSTNPSPTRFNQFHFT